MRRALIADDDPEIRGAVESVLVAAGFQVFVTESGRQAIGAAQAMPFDVAVVDYSMPPLTGVDVLAALRRLQPACVSVLLSGQLDLPIVTEAVNRGDISRILTKPARAASLMGAIDEALQARREQAHGYFALADERADLERAALEECFVDGLALAIQPFVDVTAPGAPVVGYEGLLRSRHAAFRGPLEVVAAAERQGALHRLGEATCRLARVRLEALDTEQMLFLNLHPLELDDPVRLGERLAPLEQHQSRVVLEITERSEMAALEAWRESLAVIRSKGFRVAVDDLGAGYSSLSALAAVKPEFMKVDMSLVRGVDRDAHKRQLIELLSAFARATGATLIAEGVETRAEADALIACGAHWLQGFFFGRPAV